MPSAIQVVRKPIGNESFRTVSKVVIKGRFRGQLDWTVGGKTPFRFSSSLALFSEHISRRPLHRVAHHQRSRLVPPINADRKGEGHLQATICRTPPPSAAL